MPDPLIASRILQVLASTESRTAGTKTRKTRTNSDPEVNPEPLPAEDPVGPYSPGKAGPAVNPEVIGVFTVELAPWLDVPVGKPRSAGTRTRTSPAVIPKVKLSPNLPLPLNLNP